MSESKKRAACNALVHMIRNGKIVFHQFSRVGMNDVCISYGEHTIRATWHPDGEPYQCAFDHKESSLTGKYFEAIMKEAIALAEREFEDVIDRAIAVGVGQ